MISSTLRWLFATAGWNTVVFSGIVLESFIDSEGGPYAYCTWVIIVVEQYLVLTAHCALSTFM